MRAILTFCSLLLCLSPALARDPETRDEAIDNYFAQAEESKEDSWKLEGSLGFTFKDGNTELFNFAARAMFEKKWAKELFRVTVQSIFSEEESVETASEHILLQRYEHYLSEKSRLWQQLWLETDSQESLSWRAILTAGYGYRFVKEENFVLWGELGAGWEGQTFYGGADTSEPVLQISVEWTWQITKTLEYKQLFIIWPSLSEGGEFTALSDSRFSMPISDHWSWMLIIQDKFDSDPETGNEKNDLTIIFTLNFAFSSGEKSE